MKITKPLTTFRVLGSTLVLIAFFGYMTIADELHHFAEFLGVSCILVSGLILLLIESKLNVFKNLALQWISISLLASIPFGGIILDNMPLGLTIGFALGIILAFVFGKLNPTKS